METKMCRKCRVEKSLEDFHRDRKKKDGRNSQCKSCVSEYYPAHKKDRTAYYQKYHAEHREKENEYSKKYFQEHKESVRVTSKKWLASKPGYHKKYYTEVYKQNSREKRYFSTYGITIAEYDNLFTLQNGVCAVCGKDNGKRRLCIDHDHKTGKIRGLLCHACNTTLGHSRDDVSILGKLIGYLKKNK